MKKQVKLNWINPVKSESSKLFGINALVELCGSDYILGALTASISTTAAATATVSSWHGNRSHLPLGSG